LFYESAVQIPTRALTEALVIITVLLGQ